MSDRPMSDRGRPLPSAQPTPISRRSQTVRERKEGGETRKAGGRNDKGNRTNGLIKHDTGVVGLKKRA